MMKIKHVVAAAALGTATLAPTVASADLSGNAGVMSQYLFRGLAQTDGASVYGGLDYSHDSGFYAGTWAATINFGGTPNLGGGSTGAEVDLYAGFSGGDAVTYDVGAIYYLYTEEDETDNPDPSYNTIEVYGSLGPEGAFSETTAYAPNSPYSASKAGADHLVRAYHETYGLPALVTNCSNNFGPYQYPEKLIPLVLMNAVEGKDIPIYGDGGNVRDWLYVEDHCDGIWTVLSRGTLGRNYNIGANCERTNLEVVHAICSLLDELRPDPAGPRARLLRFVADRPGHDQRYAIDASKVSAELHWSPRETFDSGLRKTVQWYLDHPGWVERVRSGAYRDWIRQNYGARTDSQAQDKAQDRDRDQG